MTSKINIKASPWDSGFTLIETLVAVLLLATAIAGPLTIASKSLTTALVAKDQIIAYYLAQDAIEYIRFKRDTNRLGGSSWLTGLDACLLSNGCDINSTTDVVTACTAACTPIKFNSSIGVYDTGGEKLPAFTRTIKITTAGANDEAIMTITVSWSDVGSVVHTITAKENLFDWQP